MKQLSSYKQNSGFTLLEMSIVMVVIGLIIGGTLVGQNLIRSAALQSVIDEKTQHAIAIKAFKDRYNYLPGDMPNATNIWGSLSGASCMDDSTEASRNSTATCNGDGSGFIGGMDLRAGAVSGNISAQIYEMFRAWQHLYNAGLVPEFYTGVYQTSADITTAHVNQMKSEKSAAEFGWNAPRAAIADNAGWNVQTLWGALNRTCETTASGSIQGNALVLATHVDGQKFNMGLSYDTARLLTAEEAKSIDRKLDDAMPLVGNVRGIGVGDMATNNQICYDDACSAGLDYLISRENSSCGLVFLNEY